MGMESEALSQPWASSVLQTLHSYQKGGVLCDFKLCSTDGRTILVHECVIAATCPLLHQETTDIDEVSGVKIKFLDCSGGVLDTIVNLVYTGIFEAEESIVSTAVDVASKIGIHLDTIPVTSDNLAIDETTHNDPDDTEELSETGTPVSVQSSELPVEVHLVDHDPTQEAAPALVSEDGLKITAEMQSLLTGRAAIDVEKLEKSGLNQDVIVKIEKLDANMLPDAWEKGYVTSSPHPVQRRSTRRSVPNKKYQNNADVSHKEPVIKIKEEGAVDGDVSFTQDDSTTAQEKVSDDTIKGKDKMSAAENCTGGQSLQCQVCSKHFATRSVLNRHTKVEHLQQNVSNIADSSKPNTKKVNSKSEHQCNICGQILSTADTLRKHQATVHDKERPFSCSHCHKTFSQKAHLQEHETVHTGARPFTCSYCEMTFAYRKSWKIHQKRHEFEGEGFKCGSCDLLFPDKRSKNRHQKTHTETYLCTTCGKKLSNAYTLKNHILHVHEDVRLYKCALCDRAFKQKAHLADHEATHSEKPFVCFYCGKKFANKKSVDKHETKCKVRQEEDASGSSRTCSECNKVFLNKKSRDRHFAKIHKSSRHFLCPDCGKVLTTAFTLKLHRQVVHQGMRSFECQYCQKAFTQKVHLIEHERCHTGMKPNICSFCGKGFASVKNLKTHERIHSSDRPFKCETCGATFKLRGALKVHNLKHTHEKRFACTLCGQRFALKATMLAHLQTHTGERPYTCEICKKTFAKRSTLQIHERRHTGLKPYVCRHCSAKFSLRKKLKNHLESIHSVTLKPYEKVETASAADELILDNVALSNVIAMSEADAAENVVEEVDQKVFSPEAIITELHQALPTSEEAGPEQQQTEYIYVYQVVPEDENVMVMNPSDMLQYVSADGTQQESVIEQS